MSPILFLIYLSGVFSKVVESDSLVTFLSFIDDLGFVASGSSIKEVVKTLEKVAKVWGKLNSVINSPSKGRPTSSRTAVVSPC